MSRRVQEPVTRLPSGREPEGDGFGLGLLAGVFVVDGFAACDGRRQDLRTCALWDRVFARPGQTDAGWLEKVSRRAQEPVTRVPSGREPEADRFGLRLLAGVFVTEGFAGCDGRRGDSWTGALWDRVFARPGQTDAGWPKKVSRRVQETRSRHGAVREIGADDGIRTRDSRLGKPLPYHWATSARKALRPHP